MNADSIKIEADEDGFHLVLQLDEEIPMVTNEGRLDVRINDCADALHEQVNLIIGSWLAEGNAVLHEMRPSLPMKDQFRVGDFRCAPEDIDESGGYALDDPKHPQFHSVHADLHDLRQP